MAHKIEFGRFGGFAVHYRPDDKSLRVVVPPSVSRLSNGLKGVDVCINIFGIRMYVWAWLPQWPRP